MRIAIQLPEDLRSRLRAHLLDDRTREQHATTLHGLHHQRNGLLRLLTRRVFLTKSDEFTTQTIASLQLSKEANVAILRAAKAERLFQCDWHTHPGETDTVAFSTVDDQYEAAMAVYIHERIPGTRYLSVVMNRRACLARLWTVDKGCARPIPFAPPSILTTAGGSHD